MEIFKMVFETGFLLFILGIYWNDIARYIQCKIANCNPKLFGLLLATLTYLILNYYVS